MIAIFLSSIVIFVCLIYVFSARLKRGNLLLAVASIWWAVLVIANRLQLSNLQLEWRIGEQIGVSLLVFLPAATTIAVRSLLPKQSPQFSEVGYYGEVEISDRDFVKSLNHGFFIIIFACCVILALDLFLYGVPLLSFTQGEAALNESRLSARTPVVLNMANQVFMICLIGLALVNLKARNSLIPLLVLVFVYVGYNVLMYSRGTVIYLITGLILVRVAYMNAALLLRKWLILVTSLIIILVLFDITGQIRQGGLEREFHILNYGEFNTNVPTFFAWFYGYFVISLDNLVMCLREAGLRSETSFTFLFNFSPSLSALFLYGDNSLDLITKVQEMPYVGRFNLITAFGFFAYDFGWVGAYLWSLFMSVIIVRYRAKDSSIFKISSDMWFIYLFIAVVFAPIGNIIFSSRVAGILFAIYLINRFIDKYNLKVEKK